MSNPLLGQILGNVFASAMRGRARTGPFTREPAGSGQLTDLLGRKGQGGAGSPMGGRGPLLALLLPLAMQWVQRNGGITEVLRRFEQKGFGRQANSWLSTGPNNPLKAEEVDEVVGGEELSRLSRQIGTSEREVSVGLADILPELVDRLTPDGSVPAEADDALDAARAELERSLAQANLRIHA